jgi:ATP-binding cassette, subfamily G (WHITE), member 2
MEKALFARERSDGLYKPITYLLSKYFDEIFITTFSSLIFSVFVWFVVDLRGSFLLFWLVYLLTLSIGISLAYLVAILSPNMDVANAALPTYVVRLWPDLLAWPARSRARGLMHPHARLFITCKRATGRRGSVSTL